MELELGADFFVSTRPGEISDMISQKDLSGYEAVIAAGGDGTLYEVVNGWMNNVTIQKPPIAVLPLGTGNSFARELGLQDNDISGALQRVKTGKKIQVDAGRFTTPESSGYFANILGVGFVTDVSHTAKLWKRFGKAAYNIAVLYRILFLKSRRLRIIAENRVIEQENLLVEISNTRYTGKNFLMAPHADWADGKFDITVARSMGRWRLLRIFPKIFRGSHVREPEVTYFQAATIHIHGARLELIGPDGELVQGSSIDIFCLPGALTILA